MFGVVLTQTIPNTFFVHTTFRAIGFRVGKFTIAHKVSLTCNVCKQRKSKSAIVGEKKIALRKGINRTAKGHQSHCERVSIVIRKGINQTAKGYQSQKRAYTVSIWQLIKCLPMEGQFPYLSTNVKLKVVNKYHFRTDGLLYIVLLC